MRLLEKIERLRIEIKQVQEPSAPDSDDVIAEEVEPVAPVFVPDEHAILQSLEKDSPVHQLFSALRFITNHVCPDQANEIYTSLEKGLHGMSRNSNTQNEEDVAASEVQSAFRFHRLVQKINSEMHTDDRNNPSRILSDDEITHFKTRQNEMNKATENLDECIQKIKAQPSDENKKEQRTMIRNEIVEKHRGHIEQLESALFTSNSKQLDLRRSALEDKMRELWRGSENLPKVATDVGDELILSLQENISILSGMFFMNCSTVAASKLRSV